MSDPSEHERLLGVREQVRKVEDVARENVEKIAVRGDRLGDLQQRADNLRDSAVDFNVTAQRLKRKMCWQNIKLWFILLFVLVVILVVLIVALVAALKKKK